jgi:CheY-like chemotaxis protein
METNYTDKIVPLNHPVTNKAATPSSKFILFGEDDKDDEDFLKELFTGMDNSFALQFIGNGRKLVSTLEQMSTGQLPCLLVLDYNMPELNGAEILKKLQGDPRFESLPKIIWSTSGSDVYKKRCLELGAKEYIIKPSNVNDLSEIVKYMLSLC